MYRVYPSVFQNSHLDGASDFFNYCIAGDLENVKNLIRQGENIYQREKFNYVPLFVALAKKNEELVNLLLDIYERDLETLNGTQFKQALIAMGDDQTEELLQMVEFQPSEDFIPVLLKTNNIDKPKCVYLRKKLKDKNDLSLKLAKKLEAKNGTCDLNWQLNNGFEEESFLHFAIYHEMKKVVQRLLNNSTVDLSLNKFKHHTPLHYALFTSNLEIINMLLSKPDFENFHDDPTYLYQAAISDKQTSLEIILKKLIESGKTMKEILMIPLPYEDYGEKITVNYLLHVIAKEGNFEGFLNNPLSFFDDDDYYIQNSKGETVLHHLMMSCLKVSVKIKMITKLVERCPKLLLIKNNRNQLPLHLTPHLDAPGQKLYRHLLKLTVKESGNPDIFYEDMEVAVSSLEEAIEVSKGLSTEFLNLFDKLLQSHGTRLLHKTIEVSKKIKTLSEILKSSAKLNPNDFYNGTNGFLLMQLTLIKTLIVRR